MKYKKTFCVQLICTNNLRICIFTDQALVPRVHLKISRSFIASKFHFVSISTDFEERAEEEFAL